MLKIVSRMQLSVCASYFPHTQYLCRISTGPRTRDVDAPHPSGFEIAFQCCGVSL